MLVLGFVGTEFFVGALTGFENFVWLVAALLGMFVGPLFATVVFVKVLAWGRGDIVVGIVTAIEV